MKQGLRGCGRPSLSRCGRELRRSRSRCCLCSADASPRAAPPPPTRRRSRPQPARALRRHVRVTRLSVVEEATAASTKVRALPLCRWDARPTQRWICGRRAAPPAAGRAASAARGLTCRRFAARRAPGAPAAPVAKRSTHRAPPPSLARPPPRPPPRRRTVARRPWSAAAPFRASWRPARRARPPTDIDAAAARDRRPLPPLHWRLARALHLARALSLLLTHARASSRVCPCPRPSRTPAPRPRRRCWAAARSRRAAPTCRSWTAGSRTTAGRAAAGTWPSSAAPTARWTGTRRGRARLGLL